MIPREEINKVKESAKIADVVHYLNNITINKTSSTKLLAHCNCCGTDKKLSVHLGKNIATCFKCDQSGRTSTLDPLGLMMHPAYGNMKFPIAVRELAQLSNIIIQDQ